MKRKHPFSLLATLLVLGPAIAGPEPAAAAAVQLVHGELRLDYLVFDNFFQMPSGSPQRRVTAPELAGRLFLRTRKDAQAPEVYLDLELRDYDLFRPSKGLLLGLRRAVRRDTIDVRGGFIHNRPTLEVGDTFGLVDTVTVAGDYEHLFGRHWQVSGGGEWLDDSNDRAPQRDGDLLTFGGSLRYRGLSRFSPEAGFSLGRRSAVLDNDAYDQRDLFFNVRSSLTRLLYVSAGYRYRLRDYSIDDPRASNFGRADHRHGFKLSASYNLHRDFSLNAYYSLEDARSPRPSRVYTSWLLVLGMSWRF